MRESWDLAFWFEPGAAYTDELLQRVAAMGVRHVGPSTFGRWGDDAAVDSLRNQVARAGLLVATYHSAVGLVFVDAGSEDRARADARRQVDIAEFLGARTVVFHHDTFRGFPDGRDEYWIHPRDLAEIHRRFGLDQCDRRMAAMLAELGPYAAAKGVTVCVENLLDHPNDSGLGAILNQLSLAGTGDSLGCCLDACHAHGSGADVAAEIRRAGPALQETHFSDNLRRPGPMETRDLHMIVGLGTIDWIDVCRALREIDYPHPIYFEGPRYPGVQRTLDTEARCIDLTIRNWRAAELASLHLPPPEA